MFERPEVDSAQALQIATKRCQSWGYTAAIPFEFINTSCQQMTSSGCSVNMVQQEYQCE